MIQTIFPTSLYIKKNILHDADLKKIQNKILQIEKNIYSGGKNWFTDVKNSLDTYDLKNDDSFMPLLKEVTLCVNEFNSMMGSTHLYECKDFWFNVYEKGDYQEFHVHSNNTYSAVFFAMCDKNSSPLVLQNPAYYYNMLPIKDIENYNILSAQTTNILPEENVLVIFRSYLQHMVPKHNSDNKRITLAFNF